MSELSTIATALCPYAVQHIHELDKGGNSRIYRVETTHATYALKAYPIPNATDPRNRLEIEEQAIRFMRAHGMVCVPDVIASDKAAMYSLLSWCDGESVNALSIEDMDAFAHFLVQLADISAFDAPHLPYASEACVSGRIILSHIEKRLDKLHEGAKAHDGLAQFLESKLIPHVQHYTHMAQQRYHAAGISFEQEIAREHQVLIPSDFGSHNALRGKNGLIFLDFEYFGWDDPATSTANFLLHPAMTLTPAQKARFAHRMQVCFSGRDPLYTLRLNALMPLFAARWATIILGEFIPTTWEHRVRSGKYKPEEKDAVLDAQLSKAKHQIEHFLSWQSAA